MTACTRQVKPGDQITVMTATGPVQVAVPPGIPEGGMFQFQMAAAPAMPEPPARQPAATSAAASSV
jgi:hypothetical protein